MALTNNFRIPIDPEKEFNQFDNQTDYQASKTGVFEIGVVRNYEDYNKEGSIHINGTDIIFRNISSVDISIGDTVVLAYANGLKHLICLGVYDTFSNTSTGGL